MVRQAAPGPEKLERYALMRWEVGTAAHLRPLICMAWVTYAHGSCARPLSTAP